MMLTGNIVLPDYQRHFVWKERDVKRLILSLNDGQFVQPVTIALYYDGTNKQNLILDGQQRLTSLLLAYLGYFPDKKKFAEGEIDVVANEDDSAEDNIEGEILSAHEGILWQYKVLLQNGNTKEQIISKISQDDRYIEMTDQVFTQLTDTFFKNTYLGFSYVVPDSNEVTDIQKNFSQMFRSINYFGKKLEPMDSRKSLYFQNPDLTDYFDGKCHDGTEVLGDLRIMEDLQPSKIDFVRYLAILSQYDVSVRKEDAKDVLVGYSAYSSRESFYADYVSYILGIEQEDRINKFERFKFQNVFPNTCWKERFQILRQTINRVKSQMGIKEDKLFSAWYEADFWLFGLMYHILFKGKILNEQLDILQHGESVDLKSQILRAIEEVKQDTSFLKNSNRVTYIRARLVKSCNIYSTYVH